MTEFSGRAFMADPVSCLDRVAIETAARATDTFAKAIEEGRISPEELEVVREMNQAAALKAREFARQASITALRRFGKAVPDDFGANAHPELIFASPKGTA
jgi:hypothetical protein